MAPADRFNEPGWRDYLRENPPSYGETDDRIRLFVDVSQQSGERRREADYRRVRRARNVWHRILAAYLGRVNGASLDDLTGKLGWFDLQATRQEVVDVIESAKVAPNPLIARESGRSASGSEVPDAEIRWIATKSVADPQGASFRDMRAAIPNVLLWTWTRAASSIATLVLILGGLGAVITSGSEQAIFIAVFAVYALTVVVVLRVLSQEAALRAAAEVWPRLHVYRQARWRFETQRARSPGPGTILAIATVWTIYAGLALMGAGFASRTAAPVTAAVVTACIVYFYVMLLIRIRPYRRAYGRALESRKPPNQR
jgi:hypothetical protein